MAANIIIAFIGAVGVAILVSGAIYPLRRKLRSEGSDLAGLDAVERMSRGEELETVPPLVDRVVGPVLRDLVGFMQGDERERAELAKRLQRSGWRYPSVGDFYAQKIMTAAVFFLGGAGGLAILGNPALFFVPLALGVLGLYIPNRELGQALTRRREALYIEMAFTLDRLAVLMQAGLAFQQALVELSRAPGKGIFLSSLRQAVTQIGLGSPVPRALATMQDTLPQEAELDKFVERARKGGPMSDALVSQAKLMRRRVEHKLLAKGLRSTLMITTVGGVFILPALALQVVGPPLVLAMRIFQF